MGVLLVHTLLQHKDLCNELHYHLRKERGTRVAQKVNIILVDDLDGSEATQTVSFGLDGANYEIDLNDEHAETLREALANYVAHGRKTGGRRISGARSSSSSSSANTSAVREWAKANGMEVSERGRIPADVQEAYDAAQRNGGTKSTTGRARRRSAEVGEDGKVKAS